MNKILLIEDDLSLAEGLSFAIRKQGYELDIAKTVKETEIIYADEKYDLILLDVSLPDGSGFDICQRIRKSSNVPIIFLTARDEEINIIMGLDIGGDDYITKPFKLAVLMSRINAILRRSNHNNDNHINTNNNTKTELNSNGIKVDLLKGLVYKNSVQLDLTAGEYKLLCFFLHNANMILSSEQILAKLWDCNESYVDSNTLTVYIRRLRAKIEDNPSNPQMIITVRRMGYKWNEA